MKGFVGVFPLILVLLLIRSAAFIYNASKTAGTKPEVNSLRKLNEPIQPTTQPIVPTEKQTNYKTINVTPRPSSTPTPTIIINSSAHIYSITPTSGKIGDVITIKGSGFGKSSFDFPDPTKWHGMVSFYGPSGLNSGGAPPATTKDWDYSWWNDDHVNVKVPGVKPGFTFQVEVESATGERSNPVSFKVLE